MLTHLNFEEMLTLIQEQPKKILSGDCVDLDKIEGELLKKSEDLINNGRMDFKSDSYVEEEKKQIDGD